MWDDKKQKQVVEKIIKESKTMMKTIDEIDEELHQSDDRPDNETMKRWARKAAGAHNYLNKHFLKLQAMVKNEKASMCHKMMIEASIQNTKFVSAEANRAANYHVRMLRLGRDTIGAYVSNAETILSIIRMHNRDFTEMHGHIN